MTENEIFERIPSLRVTEARENENMKEIKSFTLRAQRLKPYQIEALVNYFDDYCIVYDEKPLDFQKLFGNDNPVIVEIGFGMGDVTYEIAKENPDKNYIGVEVFLYGFSKLIAKVSAAGLKNIKLIRFDAVAFLENMIPDNSVCGFNIFFPDPWQKKRHHKRRLIQYSFVELLAKKLISGGFLHIVTDWEEYAEWILEECKGVEALENNYADNGGYAPLDSERLKTNFEKKGMDKGHVIREIILQKR